MHLVDENMIHVFYGAKSGECASFLATFKDAVGVHLTSTVTHMQTHTYTLRFSNNISALGLIAL